MANPLARVPGSRKLAAMVASGTTSSTVAPTACRASPAMATVSRGATATTNEPSTSTTAPTLTTRRAPNRSASTAVKKMTSREATLGASRRPAAAEFPASNVTSIGVTM